MMKSVKALFFRIVDKIIILAGTLGVLLPMSPYRSIHADRDSGVFLYIGWRILNGELPYADIWDHKPPVIFYINALGLWLSSGTRWGVWALEVAFLFIAAYLGYLLLNKLFGFYSALAGTFLWLITLHFILLNGNLTTEYTLPMQFGTLYLFYRSRTVKNSSLPFLLVGVLGGVAFLTKQTAVGSWLALVLYLLLENFLVKRNERLAREVLLICLGGIAVVTLAAGYFALNGALDEFLDSAFFYNFFYSTGRVSSLYERFWSLVDVHHLAKTGLFFTAALGLAAFLFMPRQGKTELPQGATPLLYLAAINFIFEILLINLPGSAYEHYYMTVLPAAAILSGFLFYLVDSRMFPRESQGILLRYLLTAVTIGIFLLSSLKAFRQNYWRLGGRINQAAIAFVSENTDPDDRVLIWGGETMVNYHTRRASPTRFVYQYPLYRTGYVSEELILEFLDDILENRPVFILDSKAERYPFLSFPVHSAEIDRRIEAVRSAYSEVDPVESWQVYELIPD